MTAWTMTDPAPWTGNPVKGVHFWPFAGAITLKVPFRMKCITMVPARYRQSNPRRIDEFLWHECLHDPQLIELGWLGFMRIYVGRSGRRRLEAAAYRGSVAYAVQVSGMPEAQAMDFWAKVMEKAWTTRGSYGECYAALATAPAPG